MLFARRADGAVRLVNRPARGVWGGLWSPPEFDSRTAAEQALAARTGSKPAVREGAPLLHVFTHFDLLIRPLWVTVPDMQGVAEETGALWYNAALPASVGLPAPIAQLLKSPPP
jgi:A/G-specific adenine glycosylase